METNRERERQSALLCLNGKGAARVDREKMSVSPSVCLSDLIVSPLQSLRLSMTHWFFFFFRNVSELNL